MKLNSIYKTKIRLLLIVAIVPIISIGYMLYQTYTELEYTKIAYLDYAHDISSLKKELIVKIIEERNKQALENTKDVKADIISKLNIAYGDDNRILSEDIESDYPTIAKIIINKAIEDKYMIKNVSNNRMWIANKNKILADRDIENSMEKNDRTWGEEITHAKSPILFESSIRKIISKNKNDLIFVSATNDSVIESSSKMALLDEYEIYGLDSIKKYNIIQCSYIYDHEDLLGIPDVNYDSMKADSNGLIIVQQYNLGDALEQYKDLFTAYDNSLESSDIWSKGNSITILNHLAVSIIIMLLSFFAIIGSITFYQRWGENNGSSCKDTSD